jgi:polysaccharide biosynthesis/export protein
VVFGQEGISNSYIVDAGGNISLPLIGMVPARGYTTQQLTQSIAERLKQGFVRERTSASRSRPTGRFSFSAKLPPRASIPTLPT